MAENKPIRFSEDFLQAALFFIYEKQAKAIFDNIYHFSDKDYECDILLVMPQRRQKDGFELTEFEIKIDRTDFFKDSHKELKHSNYKKGTLCPNRFYYYTPPGLLTIDEIPSHAGLIELHEKRLKTIKRAPILTDEVFTEESLNNAYKKMYYRYFTYQMGLSNEVLKEGPKPKRRSSFGRRRRRKTVRKNKDE